VKAGDVAEAISMSTPVEGHKKSVRAGVMAASRIVRTDLRSGNDENPV